MDEPGGSDLAQGEERPDAGAVAVASAPKIGVLAWSFVGVVVATIIVVTAFSYVSEILLPLLFAAVLAVIFKPMVGSLQRRGLKPSLAAGLIVLGLLILMAVVLVATVKGVLDQTDEIGASVDAAIDNASDELSIDQSSLEDARAATEEAGPTIAEGVLTKFVEGINSLLGLVSGLILGALIMYYLLKDGSTLRRNIVAKVDPSNRGEVDGFIGDACGILRDYGRGRTVMSATVAVVVALAALLLGLPLVFTIFVVNFIGGYIPYIGAFLGGGLAVIIALGDGGIGIAADHARDRARLEPAARELRGAQGDGPDPRYPPLGRACRDGARRLPRRHRRPDPGGAVHGDRRQRHRTPPIERLLRARGGPSPAGRATDPRLTHRVGQGRSMDDGGLKQRIGGP